MSTESVLPIIRSCITCKFREDRLFCNLGADALKELDSLKRMRTFSEGEVLFSENELADEVMILCQGKVKLSISSADGKKIILSIAEPGEVMGMGSVIASHAYESTAEALEPVQVNSIGRREFMNFLQRFQQVALHAARELSEAQIRACSEIKLIGLGQSVPQKLAMLILQWDGKAPAEKKGKVKLALTHEEVAQLLGTSRETVTRALTELKKKKLIEVHGVDVHILNYDKLRQAAGV